MISKNTACLFSRRGFTRRMLQLCAFPVMARGVLAASDQRFANILKQALHDAPWTLSTDVILDVPQLAENGAIVPVTIESLVPETRRILVFAENNPGPLLAEFLFERNADPWVSLRLKLNESGPVLAIAEAGGHFYGVSADVRVMVGGCS